MNLKRKDCCLAAAFLVISLLLSACGDNINTTAPVTTTASATTVTTLAATTVAVATSTTATTVAAGTTAAVTTTAAAVLTTAATTAANSAPAPTATVASAAAAPPPGVTVVPVPAATQAADTLAAVKPAFTIAAGKKLTVVTSVAPLTNIALNIGGTRINLTGLIPDGVDSHTFEPAASDAKTLADADLIILNGLHLEEPTRKLAEGTKHKEAVIVLLGEATITPTQYQFDFSFPKDKGDPNPHLWMNPQYAMNYARVMHDLFVKYDPANKDYYDQNQTTYLAQLTKMDQVMAQALATVPAQNRRLLTYHDSYAYWANHFGWQVLGAIQPADFKEPSAKEIAELIDQLKKEKVPAIFGSEVFPSKTLEQIGKEAGVKYVDTLRDDDLPGEKDDPQHTYIGMQLANTVTMVNVLGGKPDALRGFNPANTFQK